MDLMDILPRFVGAFYAVGGWFALRALLTSDMLDRVLSALRTTPGSTRNDAIRRWVLGGAGLVTCISGVALVLMSRWALPLFVVNLAAQAGWLVWARTAFPPEDEEDVEGRRAVINAAIGYAAVTALVFWLDARGRLGPFADPLPIMVLGLSALTLGAWLVKHLSWNPGALPQDWDDPMPHHEPERREPLRLRLEPRIGDWSLWDADDGRGIDPQVYLPPDLAERLEAWEDAHQQALDPEDPDGPVRFETRKAALAHLEAGRALVADLEAIYGLGSVEGPVYEVGPWPATGSGKGRPTGD